MPELGSGSSSQHNTHIRPEPLSGAAEAVFGALRNARSPPVARAAILAPRPTASRPSRAFISIPDRPDVDSTRSTTDWPPDEDSLNPLRPLLRYRDLVNYLVVRNLKVRYRRSSIGFAWTMLQPLLTMLVLQMVFNSIFRFELDHGNYPVYALAGILFWNFFSQSVLTSMNSLKANASLLTKLPVPKFVFPLATVLAGVVNLVLALVPLFVILIVTGHPLRPALLFLPLSILVASAFTFGIGLLLSPLAAFFSDVIEVVNVLLTMAMYLTPIFYPMDIVPDRYRWIVRFNPIRSVLEVFRDPIYFGKVPPFSHLSVTLLVTLLALVIGGIAFHRSSDRIAFYV